MKTYSFAELSQRPGVYENGYGRVAFVTLTPSYCISTWTMKQANGGNLQPPYTDVSDQYDLVLDGPTFTGVKRRTLPFSAFEPGVVYRREEFPDARYIVTIGRQLLKIHLNRGNEVSAINDTSNRYIPTTEKLEVR